MAGGPALTAGCHQCQLTDGCYHQCQLTKGCCHQCQLDCTRAAELPGLTHSLCPALTLLFGLPRDGRVKDGPHVRSVLTLRFGLPLAVLQGKKGGVKDLSQAKVGAGAGGGLVGFSVNENEMIT